MKTLLKNAHVLTMDDRYTEYEKGWVLTEGSRILSLGNGPCPEADHVIDCEGAILLPGFVNLHCHASMVPFRTMGDDCPDRLRRFLFPLENEALTPELTYLGAKYGIGEMLLSGITTFVDMYYFEDEVAKACLETGMQGFLGETVISQKTPDSEDAAGGLRLTEDFIRRYAANPRIHPVIAPHGTTTVSEDALRACAALSEQTGALLTLHASEMDYEISFFRDRGETPMSYLDRIGFLSERLLAAHCIHLTGDDLRLMKTHGVRIAHCIGSNAKAGKGVSPIRDAAALGIPFGFGTDGPSSGNTLSLFDQMRLFAVTQKTKYHDRSLFPAREIVRAATRGGSECLHMEARSGMLAPGLDADLVTVSTKSAHMFPLYNPYSALVYSANASDVDLVMAGGRIVVRDHRITDWSMEQLREDLSRAMSGFYASAEKYRDMI